LEVSVRSLSVLGFMIASSSAAKGEKRSSPESYGYLDLKIEGLRRDQNDTKGIEVGNEYSVRQVRREESKRSAERRERPLHGRKNREKKCKIRRIKKQIAENASNRSSSYQKATRSAKW